MNSLVLNKAQRKIGKNQTPRDYLDFFVSGQSLKTILGIEKADFVTLLGWGVNDQHDRNALNVFRLRERSETESGRVMIYVCPECGDIDCGAVTAEIRDFGDRIIWSNFGYETNSGGISETYTNIEPIEFEREAYFAAFSRL